MEKELRTYLEWRFRISCINKYQKYRDLWIDNIPESNLWYYREEMFKLKNNGLY